MSEHDAPLADQSADAGPLALYREPRRDEIVREWFAAIGHTSFSGRPAAELRSTLRKLLDETIAALAAEPPARARARAVGAELVRLRYLQPEALEDTLRVLGRELTAGLEPAQLAHLQSRVGEILASLAAGFTAEARAVILEQQDQIRRALFVSREAADAAEQGRRAAEAAAQARTNVLNAAAHDLRGPVTLMQTSVQMLLRGLEREEAPSREWVRARAERIADGTRRISAMIEELLDAAQLQSGRQLTLHIDRVDVGALVRDVVRARQSAADTGQIPLIFEGASGLEIRADPVRLERVVDNVLTNAIKYSSPGNPVEVEVRRHDGGAMISIRDRGVGIPSDELGKIFTPFYRASTAREVPGIGIGLSGAKMIVDQHGGEITISSTPGHGTLVRIALPADLPSVH